MTISQFQSDGDRTVTCRPQVCKTFTRTTACLLAVLALHGAPARACDAPDDGYRRVAAVSPRGDISLSDGTVLRLAGLHWPWAEAARTRYLALELDTMLAGAEVAFLPTAAQADRWQRRSVQVFVRIGPDAPAIWLQADLLERGLVFAWPDKPNTECWTALQQAENHAIKAGIGVWSPVSRRMHRFRAKQFGEGVIPRRIVYEGRVSAVREGRTVNFVNFSGPRTAAPVFMIQKRKIQEWQRNGRDPAIFAGKTLRIRGMISRTRLPRLDVSGPLSVEVLEQ